jgi:peptidoglycan/LPS O-acetylase OafA/YrhL
LQSDLKIAPGKRIPQLDGLRGIAILMVMCYHFFPNNIICNFGWSGVDLFFVLSGFLITGRLYPYLDDKKILLKFYRNRFLRIVPLYFGFLVVFLLDGLCSRRKQPAAQQPLIIPIGGSFSFSYKTGFLQLT